MTRFDGDVHEMPVPPLDDRALDALLSGAHSSQSGLDWLIPFVEDLGQASSGSAPAAQPALAMLLAQGFSPEDGAQPARRAPRGRTWRTMAVRVAMGLTVAAAGTTVAGAVGMLPDPAQHVVATVVGAATPFTFPDEADDNAGSGTTVSADATGASDQVGVDGKVVSDAAKTKQDAGHRTEADGSGSQGVGANSGATGLDRANETPAAGHAPTSVPAATGRPVAPGSQASNGLDTARSTPAADNVPARVPPATPAADAGGQGPGVRDDTNPAADRRRSGTRGRP